MKLAATPAAAALAPQFNRRRRVVHASYFESVLGEEDDVAGRAATQVNGLAGLDAAALHHFHQFLARPEISRGAQAAVEGVVEQFHVCSACAAITPAFICRRSMYTTMAIRIAMPIMGENVCLMRADFCASPTTKPIAPTFIPQNSA